jgi:CRP-like cAMP-binding protein
MKRIACMWTEPRETGLALYGEPALPRNLVLRALPSYELELLSPLLDRVPLTPRRVLQHAGLPIEHVFFIESGLVSALAKVDEGDAVEVGLIGRDGVVGSAVLLGATAATLSHFVQLRGSALRISVEDLDRVISELPSLREALKGYLHLFLMQSAQAAACGLRHSFQQRLARWLLMAHDRSGMDHLSLTQDLVARNLGVRRATVSETFKLLEQRGVFAKDRGMVRILDRRGLERVACRCYRTMCQQRDAWKRSLKSRKALFVLSLLGALFELELAVQ